MHLKMGISRGRCFLPRAWSRSLVSMETKIFKGLSNDDFFDTSLVTMGKKLSETLGELRIRETKAEIGAG